MNVFEKEWKNLLREQFQFGEMTHKDDSEILEIIGNHVFVPSPYEPYLNLGSSKNFLESIKNGRFDIKEYPMKGEGLHDYVASIYDESKIFIDDEDVNDFVYSYPQRLINYNGGKDYQGTNQFVFGILERLGNNSGSNRAIATTLIPNIDCDREDIPCLQSLQALIRDDKLILSVFFRSNDLYGAWVSNMMFLTNIGLGFVDELKKYKYPNLVFKGIDYHSSSLHIYKTDLEQAKKVIS